MAGMELVEAVAVVEQYDSLLIHFQGVTERYRHGGVGQVEVWAEFESSV